MSINTSKSHNRAKNLCGVIYPDDPNFAKYLAFIKTLTHFYILHDRSYDDEEGVEKKPHVHFLVRYENAVSISGFIRAMGIPDNYIQVCTNSKSYIRYMTHIDEPDKEQYEIGDIKTNDYLFRTKCFESSSHEQFMINFLNYISSFTTTIYLGEVLAWSIKKGLYDDYFRNYKIIRDIVFQENDRRLTKYVAREVEWSEDKELPF